MRSLSSNLYLTRSKSRDPLKCWETKLSLSLYVCVCAHTNIDMYACICTCIYTCTLNILRIINIMGWQKGKDVQFLDFWICDGKVCDTCFSICASIMLVWVYSAYWCLIWHSYWVSVRLWYDLLAWKTLHRGRVLRIFMIG